MTGRISSITKAQASDLKSVRAYTFRRLIERVSAYPFEVVLWTNPQHIGMPTIGISSVTHGSHTTWRYRKTRDDYVFEGVDFILGYDVTAVLGVGREYKYMLDTGLRTGPT